MFASDGSSQQAEVSGTRQQQRTPRVQIRNGPSSTVLSSVPFALSSATTNGSVLSSPSSSSPIFTTTTTTRASRISSADVSFFTTIPRLIATIGLTFIIMSIGENDSTFNPHRKFSHKNNNNDQHFAEAGLRQSHSFSLPSSSSSFISFARAARPPTKKYRIDGTILHEGNVSTPFVNKLSLCYLIFGPIEDMGYSYAKNIGKLATEKYLRTKFPTVDFSFRLAEKFSTSNRSKVLWEITPHCDHVMMSVDPSDEDLLRQVATAYPQKYFFPFNAFWYRDQPKNVIPYNLIYSEIFYVGGAVAAAQSTNCVSMVPAFEIYSDPASAANGLLHGIRSVNSTMPFHVLTQNDWYNPTRELQAATALDDAVGCDVILHFTDAVSTPNVAKLRGRFTNGVHADQGTFLGDSLLFSATWHWEVAFIKFAEEYLLNGGYNTDDNSYLFGLDTGIASITDVSPIGSDAARKERETSLARFHALGGSAGILYCNRTIVSWDDQIIFTPTESQPCIPWDNVMNTNYFEKGIIRHPTFLGYDICGPGTFAFIVKSPLISIECVPCPSDTFSAFRGVTQCIPCESGYTADEGATECKKVPQLNLLAIVLPIVGAIVLAAIIIFLLYGRVQLANRHAPRTAPLCLVFTDIESSTALWESFPTDMMDAIQTHHSIIRRLIEEYQGYEVKVVGDAFMVAFASPMNGILFCADVQRALLNDAEWPTEIAQLPPSANAILPNIDAYDIANGEEPPLLFRGLRIRMGAHWCVDANARYDRIHQRYDYYGPDVNTTARIETSAFGGQILVSEHLWEEACRDASFELAAATMDAEEWGAVELKGVAHPYTLYEVVCHDFPRQFINKNFPVVDKRRQSRNSSRLNDATYSEVNSEAEDFDAGLKAAQQHVSAKYTTVTALSNPVSGANSYGVGVAAEGGSRSPGGVGSKSPGGTNASCGVLDISAGALAGGGDAHSQGTRSVGSHHHHRTNSYQGHKSTTNTNNTNTNTNTNKGETESSHGHHSNSSGSRNSKGSKRPEVIAFQVLNTALNKLPQPERALLIKRLCTLHLPPAIVKALPASPVAQLATLANALKKSVSLGMALGRGGGGGAGGGDGGGKNVGANRGGGGGGSETGSVHTTNASNHNTLLFPTTGPVRSSQNVNTNLLLNAMQPQPQSGSFNFIGGGGASSSSNGGGGLQNCVRRFSVNVANRQQQQPLVGGAAVRTTSNSPSGGQQQLQYFAHVNAIDSKSDHNTNSNPASFDTGSPSNANNVNGYVNNNTYNTVVLAHEK